jgi:hypothetical protein
MKRFFATVLIALCGLFLNPAQAAEDAAALLRAADRWRPEVSLRRHGGPADALLAQLPLRRTGYVAATLAF